MNIPTAKAILTETLKPPYSLVLPKTKEAIELGIEALKQIQQIRAYAKELFLPLLPRETK